ncbi:MAG: division/cell wall cluster transcriptional repressor MraZ [Vicinamibacteria bacterium]
MFRGLFEHTVDPKGRLSIPSKFREALAIPESTPLILTRLDHCLAAYPLKQWRTLEQKLNEMPQMRKEVKRFQRFFVSGAIECSPDRQGRILIPPLLRRFAGLQKDVVLAGMLTRFEIWAKDRWEEEIERSRIDFDQISATLAELGL